MKSKSNMRIVTCCKGMTMGEIFDYMSVLKKESPGHEYFIDGDTMSIAYYENEVA